MQHYSFFRKLPPSSIESFLPIYKYKSGRLLNDVMMVSMLVTESKEEALSSDKD